MCLISNNKYPIKAIEDITCYKVIADKGDHWMAPYMLTTHKFGRLSNKDHINVEESKFGTYYVGRGYFHLNMTIEDTKHNEYKLKKWWKNINIVKCTIPKGANYYRSVANCEICADEIIIDKNEIINV